MPIYQDGFLPYSYLIGWSNLDMWYYGVEYKNHTVKRVSKQANPNNLWKTYFTSSNKVKNFRKIHGEPDIIEVRKTFSSAKGATDWECRFLTRVKAAKSDNWLNDHNGKRNFYSNGRKPGFKHSEETRSKLKKAKENFVFTDEHKRKISEAGIGNTRRKGKKTSPEAIRKFSEKMKGRKQSQEHISKRTGGNSLKFIAYHPINGKVDENKTIKTIEVNADAFCKKYGLARSCVTRCINGVFKQHRGYTFERLF